MPGLRLFGTPFPLVAGILPPHIPRLRALLTGRVLAMLALLLAGAGVQAAMGVQGHLPTDTTPVQGAEKAIAQAQAAGIDFGAVIEKVRHHIAPAPGKGSVLAVESRLYRAEFGPGGFGLTLRRSLSEQQLAARTAAWHATHPPIPSDVATRPGETALPLPAESNPFAEARDFGVALQDLRRDEQALPVSPGRWRGEYNQVVRNIAPGVTERVTAREGGIEWDFVLHEPPAGKGPLRISAAIAAAEKPERVSTTAPALRWRVADGRHVRMGELVVTDAAGRELHRALPQADDGRVTLTVPASVLAQADYPLTLDPVISPDYPVSEPVYQSLPAGSRYQPAVAFNREAGFDASFLVVWSDTRFGDYDVFATRVSTDGVLLDPVGIAVSTAAGDQQGPRVASQGYSFLIVWQDERSGIDWDVYGARVSSNGFLIDTPADSGGIPISAGAGDQGAPAITFNTDAITAGYLVVWADRRSGVDYDIYGARVNNAGLVIEPNGFAISTAADYQGSPSAASSGSASLVAWTDDRGADNDIYGALVSAEGVVVATDLAISTAASHQAQPAVAAQPGSIPIYLVVWRDARSGDWDIYGARLGSNGSLLDGPAATGGIAISTPAGSQQLSPSVAWGSSDFLAVWQDPRDVTAGNGDIYAARITPGGTLLDGPPATGGIALTDGDKVGHLAIASDPWGDRYLVAWAPSSGSAIGGVRVSHTGTLEDGSPGDGGLLLTPGANPQTDAAIASYGSNFFVAWTDKRESSNPDIYAARVNAAGTLLDGSGIPVATSTALESRPVVSWNGTNLLVVWSQQPSFGDDNTDIHGMRIGTDGALLDGPPDGGGMIIADTTAIETRPDTAWNGTQHLVVWEAYTVTPGPVYSDTDVRGRFITPDGSVSVGLCYLSLTNILSSSLSQWGPAVTSDGSDFLLAWDQCTHPFSGSSRACVSPTALYAQRLNPAGCLIGNRVPVSIEANYADVDWGDGNYLVAWHDRRFDWDDGDVYAARLGPDASLLDGPVELGGIPVCTDPGWQSRPSLVWNGASYVIAWSMADGAHYARLSPAGALLDSPATDCGLPLISSPTTIAMTAADGKAAVAHSSRTTEMAYTGAERVFLRWIDFNADLSIENYGLPYTAAVGGEVTYTLTIRNAGPNVATGVTVTDTLPAGVLFVSATPEQGDCSEAGGVVTCNLGERGVGGFTQIDIVVVPTATGSLSNTAEVHSNEPDPNTGDNSVTYVSVVVDGADVGVTKSDAVDPVVLGDTVAYTVTVTNHGPSDATGVQVDEFPQGAIQSYATSQGSCFPLNPPYLTCFIGDLAVGAGATVTLEVAAGFVGTMTNNARVSAFEPDPNPDNDLATEQTSVYDPDWAEIAVTKSANPTAVVVAEAITYTVTVSNNGPAAATGIALDDTLPPNVDPLSATASQGSCAIGPTVSCALGTIAPAAGATVQIVVTAVSEGPASNSVSVSATETDPATSNNVADALSTVHPADDSDGDGAWDHEDNCINVPNGPLIPDAGGNSQRDTDIDGYGNICDGDLDNSGGVVNFGDLALFKTTFGSSDPAADFDGSGGVVNFGDLATFKQLFGQPPGPSCCGTPLP